MNRRKDMKNVREILRLVNENKLSIRQIGISCNCSPTTVSTIILRYNNSELPWEDFKTMDDSEMESKLYPQEIKGSKKTLPDWDYVHKELKGKGVTLLLLWQEYKEKYPDGIMYSRFCDYYHNWRKLTRLSAENHEKTIFS